MAGAKVRGDRARGIIEIERGRNQGLISVIPGRQGTTGNQNASWEERR